MKRLACLVAVALALPCAASGPTAPRMGKRKPPPEPPILGWVPVAQLMAKLLPPPPPLPLLSDRLVRTVLLPQQVVAGTVLMRVPYFSRLDRFRAVGRNPLPLELLGLD